MDDRFLVAVTPSTIRFDRLFFFPFSLLFGLVLIRVGCVFYGDLFVVAEGSL
jgi:hypothetical protein